MHKSDIANKLVHGPDFPSPQPRGPGARGSNKQCVTAMPDGAFFVRNSGRAVDAAAARRARADAAPIEQNFAGSLTAMPTENLGVSGAFYVPVYSSVSMSQGKLRADFSVTLSVHNASETRPLVLKRIAYFDTSGKMVESYLKAPVALKPFSTVEVFIAATDVRGGTGANFVVDWAADRRDRRAGGRGADGRRVGQRTLRLHQPGPADAHVGKN